LEQLRGDEEVAGVVNAAHAHQAHQTRVAQLREGGAVRRGTGASGREGAGRGAARDQGGVRLRKR
jgi:hypothetical protein